MMQQSICFYKIVALYYIGRAYNTSKLWPHVVDMHIFNIVINNHYQNFGIHRGKKLQLSKIVKKDSLVQKGGCPLGATILNLNSIYA